MHSKPARRPLMPRWPVALAAISAMLTAVAPGAPAQASQSTAGAVQAPASHHHGYRLPAGVRDPCAAPRGKHAACAALTVAGSKAGGAQAAATAAPAGLAPADLQDAYNLPKPNSLGNGETVAVVTAYDDPSAEADLGTYRTQFSLPACTTANGCFKKVDQNGGTTYPPTSAGWPAADAQSMDMISALCPSCDIVLVEANSTAITDLGAAENEAARLGAGFIDNDWFTPEPSFGSSETGYDTQYFDHPGTAITAPAGNSGYGVSYPAASQFVTAVGGTTLTKDTNVSRGWTETAWSGSGSGCSAYEPKPSWQTDTGCAGRTLNDTAAVADPGTPVAYYDSQGSGGWAEGGGTGVAAAIVAATYALAGPPAPGTIPASYLYGTPGDRNAVTSGSDGTCSPSYLCTAGSGYNGPGGMGTPWGAAALGTTGAKPAAIVTPTGTTWVFARGTDGSVQAGSLPSGSSTWSGLTSLGGNFPAYPAALAGAGGFTWVMAVANGNLYVDELPNGSATWTGFSSLGNPGTGFIGTPAVVQDTAGEIHVFARTATGTMYTAGLPSGSSTWSSFSSLGGTWPRDAGAIVGSGGYLFVFAVGTTQKLYVDELPSGSATWTGWTSLGGTTIGVPTAMQDQAGPASGTIRVFVRATTGAMQQDSVPFHSTTWSGLSSLGGSWQQDAADYPGSGGTGWLYAVGSTTNLYYDKLVNGTWSGWTNLNGSFTGAPGARQNDTANYLFGRTADGALDAAHVDNGTSTWSAFSNLGGPVAGS